MNPPSILDESTDPLQRSGLPGPSDLTAGALEADYASGRRTPASVVADLLTREQQAEHSGFISVETGRASTAASSSTRRWQRGSTLGPLDGIPHARKDMFFRAGTPMDCGTTVLARTMPTVTSTLLDRLDAAGAIDTGRLHMSELAMSPMGRNDQLGPGRNPWDPDRVSGGSSSGSAMAVAQGLATFSLGSDTGGSVRIPAAACGVSGLKPTQGLLSQTGMMPLSPSLDCAGVLARTAADIGRVMDVITGVDPSDSASQSADPDGYSVTRDASATGVTLVVPLIEVGPLATPEVVAAVEEVVAALESAGARVKRSPSLDLSTGERLASIMTSVEGAATFMDELARNEVPTLGTEVQRRLHRALLYPATTYVRAFRLREHLLSEFLDELLPPDAVMVIPTLPHEAPLIQETREGSPADIEAAFGLFSRWTRTINYLGLPALTVPAGFGRHGMPLGVQLLGRPFGERRLLTLADCFQQQTDWHLRWPGQARTQ